MQKTITQLHKWLEMNFGDGIRQICCVNCGCVQTELNKSNKCRRIYEGSKLSNYFSSR